MCATDAAAGAEVERRARRRVRAAQGDRRGDQPGRQVWWATADGNVKAASATGLWPVGTAVRAAGTGDASVRVRLDGVALVSA